MKKWFKVVMAAALPFAAASFVSCTSDEDLPDVTIKLDVTEGTVVDGTIYVAQGQTLAIGDLTVTNNQAGKGAAIAHAAYYWDGLFVAPAPFAPFATDLEISENTPLGNHNLGVTCTVLAVDKSMANAALNFPVVVVADVTDIPGYVAPEQPENGENGENTENGEVGEVVATVSLQK